MATGANPLEGIQQDKDGNYIDTVDLGDGSGPQVFKGKTVAELLAKYRKAQENATRKIREQALALKMRQRPDPARRLPDYKPHVPTPDEMWQLSEDLKDPTKAPAAMRRATEWELGASLDEVRETLRQIAADRAKQEVFAAGKEFMDAHPEYVPCAENESAIYAYLNNNNLDFTKRNFEIAFDELRAGLVLRSAKQVSQGNETPDARIEPVVTRPRLASTGLSSRQSSVAQPRETPNGRPGKLTVADIDNMPLAEYERRLSSDPAFAAEAARVLEAASARR